LFLQTDALIFFMWGMYVILSLPGLKGMLLVVGLNSDASVKSIKPDNRPNVTQEQRAEVLSSLAIVDFITIFDESDLLALISAIKPDILVKGADWKEKEIVGADVVKAYGGKVVRVEVVPGISTSRIIRRIIKRFQKEDGD